MAGSVFGRVRAAGSASRNALETQDDVAEPALDPSCDLGFTGQGAGVAFLKITFF